MQLVPKEAGGGGGGGGGGVGGGDGSATHRKLHFFPSLKLGNVVSIN